MKRIRAFRFVVLFLAPLFALGAGWAPPAAAVTDEEAAQLVAERFRVEVLKVRPGMLEGRAVWLVTVMNPGADSNSAFVVSTVAVDRASGEPLRNFKPIETGSLPAAGPLAAEETRSTGTPPGPGSREAGDSGGAAE